MVPCTRTGVFFRRSKTSRSMNARSHAACRARSGLPSRHVPTGAPGAALGPGNANSRPIVDRMQIGRQTINADRNLDLNTRRVVRRSAPHKRTLSGARLVEANVYAVGALPRECGLNGDGRRNAGHRVRREAPMRRSPRAAGGPKAFCGVCTAAQAPRLRPRRSLATVMTIRIQWKVPQTGEPPVKQVRPHGREDNKPGQGDKDGLPHAPGDCA